MSQFHFPRFLTVALLFLALGCTSTSGTIVPLDKPTIDAIRAITVVVEKEEDFSVIKSREQKSNVGAVMFGLIGAAVEHAAAASSDRDLRNNVLPMLGDYQPDLIFANKLKDVFISSNKVVTVEAMGDGKIATPTSANLKVALKEWGLRPCLGSGVNEQLQVGLHIESKLMKSGSDSPLWQRDELYLSHDCHAITDYQTQDNLLRDSLTHAISDLAAKTANEIIYP